MRIRTILKPICYFSIIFPIIFASSARAELDFGFKARYLEDYTTALEELRPLAESGDAQSQLSLGLMYYYGRGVTWNPRLADLWIRKSAYQLYHDAEFTVRFLYGGFTGGNPIN